MADEQEQAQTTFAMRTVLRELQNAVRTEQNILTQETDLQAPFEWPSNAERERADMTRIASRLAVRVEDGGTIDNKGLRRRFKSTGRKDSDFTKWERKARIFVSASFGSNILAAMGWAKNLRKPVKGSSQGGRTVSYEDVFGANADGLQRILDLEWKLHNVYA